MTSMFDFLDNVGGERPETIISQAEMQMAATGSRKRTNQLLKLEEALKRLGETLDSVRHISGKGRA